MLLHETLRKHRNNYVQVPLNHASEDAKLTASFVIPVYNSVATLADCVDSVVAQVRSDLIQEVILVDDGSTDGSLEEMRRIAAQYPHVRILVEANGTRKYAAHSRNAGIMRATADLICFIDSDIILPPEYLQTHILQHQADSKCVTFSLRSNVTSRDQAVFPMRSAESDFRHKLLYDKSALQDVSFNFCDTHTLAELCLTCAVTYRRDDLLKVKGCPDSFKGWGFNDTAMAAKVISIGRSVVPMYEMIVAHLEHAPRSGTSSAKWAEFAKNKHRYELMLKLPAEDTFSFHLEALDI
jgi:glycosyltransferase involved in cell wall biosynthesis